MDRLNEGVMLFIPENPLISQWFYKLIQERCEARGWRIENQPTIAELDRMDDDKFIFELSSTIKFYLGKEEKTPQDYIKALELEIVLLINTPYGQG